MEQNYQVEQREKEISLSMIFKLLLSKVKLLIFVLLAGAIAGCSFGIVRTYDTHYYGTTLQFYVNPKSADSSSESQSQYGVYGAYGKNIMDNMVKLLESEIFAEKLLLNELGLPNEYRSTSEYIEAEKAIILSNEKLAIIKETEEELELLELDIPLLTKDENTFKTMLQSASTKLETARDLLLGAQTGGTASTTQAEYKAQLDKAQADFDQAEKDFNEAFEKRTEMEKTIIEMEKSLKLAQREAGDLLTSAEKKTEVVLKKWRDSKNYKQQLKILKQAVSYSYLKDVDLSNNNADSFARSFFYVDISVLNDKEFAEGLYEAINRVLPSYIEDKMAVPSGYVGTSCFLSTTLNDIENLNPGLMRSQVIKFGLLFAAAAFVITCLVLIIKENANKKLRDYDELSRNLQLPVLGVIPSLDGLINQNNNYMKGGDSNE